MSVCMVYSLYVARNISHGSHSLGLLPFGWAGVYIGFLAGQEGFECRVEPHIRMLRFMRRAVLTFAAYRTVC